MISLNVNGQQHQVDVDPRTPLLYVLRNELKLNAAKFGCGLGQCGSCTVLVGKNPVFSCLTPVSVVAGRPARPTIRVRCRRPLSRSNPHNAATASPA